MNNPLDFSNTASIGYSRIVASVNQFAERTVDFLNRFSNICDLKLLEVSERLNNLEILTTVLEKKLQSVNGLNFTPGQKMEVVDQPPPPPTTVEENNNNSNTNNNNDNNNDNNNSENTSNENKNPDEQKQEQNENNESKTEQEEAAYSPRNDPLYAKWFKLKDIGVPIIALTPKMLAEGLDPNVLREGAGQENPKPENAQEA